MSDTRRATRIDHRSVAEDFALEALLSIERVWERAHRDHELVPDPWGEGPSRVRLVDLGLDPRVRTHALTGVCHRHGAFSTEWSGRIDEDPPDFARCTATTDGERCVLDGPVTRTGGPSKR
jgi:hypothetical protein